MSKYALVKTQRNAGMQKHNNIRHRKNHNARTIKSLTLQSIHAMLIPRDIKRMLYRLTWQSEQIEQPVDRSKLLDDL